MFLVLRAYFPNPQCWHLLRRQVKTIHAIPIRLTTEISCGVIAMLLARLNSQRKSVLCDKVWYYCMYHCCRLKLLCMECKAQSLISATQCVFGGAHFCAHGEEAWSSEYCTGDGTWGTWIYSWPCHCLTLWPGPSHLPHSVSLFPSHPHPSSCLFRL